MGTKKNLLSVVCLLVTLGSYSNVWAYEDEKTDQSCKDPKFRDFNLTVYDAKTKLEVPPESEISFTLSGWTNPETIKVTAKNKPLDISIENRNTFFIITTKLPPEFSGKFVRINASAKAVLGCKAEEGWLLKVAKLEQNAPEVTGEVKQETENQQKSDALVPPVSESIVQDKPIGEKQVDQSDVKSESKPAM